MGLLLNKKAHTIIIISIILVSTVLTLASFDYLRFIGSKLVTVKGNVTDENGDPMAGVNVCIGNCTVLTDQKGQFSLTLGEGVYNLTIIAEGYEVLNDVLHLGNVGVKELNCRLSRTDRPELKPRDGKFSFNNSDCKLVDTKIGVDSECDEKIFLFSVKGRTYTSYLRNVVGEFYEDGVWSVLSQHQLLRYVGGILGSNVTGYTEKLQVTFEIQPLVTFGGFIPSTENPDSLSLKHPLIYYIDQQIFFSEQIFTNSYNISYSRYYFDLEVLKSAKVSYETNYMSMPLDLLEKLEPLAQNITSKYSTQFEKLIALETFLRENYQYDKKYNKTPIGMDPVEWFLFYSRRGVCTHFNSAFVLLARSIGIPARLVAGYLINPFMEQQIVKSCQRHAYAEVLFDNIGWITFDATAPCNCYMEPVSRAVRIINPSEDAYVSGSKIIVAGEAIGFYKNAELVTNRTDFSLTFWDGDFAFENHTYIQDGALAIEVSVSDAGGNIASDSVRFTVDNTPPIVLIRFPSNGMSLANQAVKVDGTVDELNKGYSQPLINDTRFSLVYWDYSTGEFSFVNKTPISGYIKVEVSFRDLAQNMGSAIVAFNVTGLISTLIPTRTNITRCSLTALKGSTFLVEGNVLNFEGNPVSNLNVIVYIAKDKNGNKTLIGNGKVESGYFNITCHIPKELSIGDYIVFAETVGDHEYEGSCSDPPLKVMAETVVEFSSPEKVIMGRSFTVNAVLKEKLSFQPIINETLHLTINSESYSLITDYVGQGVFNVSIWQPGKYTITLTFKGSEYYLNSSCSGSLCVLPITISPATMDTLVREDLANLTGRVHADDMPLDFENLTVIFDGLTFKIHTDSSGYFKEEFKVPENQTLGKTLIEYILDRYNISIAQTVKVLSRTSLVCKNVPIIKSGQLLNITAFLTDNINYPVMDAAIKFSFAFRNENKSFVVRTNEEGASLLNITVPRDFSGKLEYKAVVEGNMFYLSSFYNDSLNVVPTSNSTVLPVWLAGLLTPVALVSVVIWRFKKRKTAPKTCSKLEAAEVKAPAEIEKPILSIEFLQIPSVFPLVWGVNEPLEVKVALYDPSGKPIKSAIVTLSVGKFSEKQLKTYEEGKAKSTYIFNEKGTYKFRASFKGENWDEVNVETEVRIVDYKEEIVQLFNIFFTTVKEKFNNITGEMTPRELQSTLINQVSQPKQDALENIISIFEIANYSLHLISRKEYEQMYLSIKDFMS